MITLLLAVALTAAPYDSTSVAADDTIAAKDRLKAEAYRAKREIDKILDMRDSRARSRVDTSYIERTPQRLRFRLTLNASGSDIRTRGVNADGNFNTEMKAQNKYTVSLSAAYRGLSLSVAMNPAHLAGEKKDYELNMNAYGNKLGADVIFHSAKTFEGNVHTQRGDISIPAGLISQNMLTLNAYYAFNGRRFSYPAVFSQSWMQKRSCGSLMLGASFMGGVLKARHDDVIGNPESRLSILCVGLRLQPCAASRLAHTSVGVARTCGLQPKQADNRRQPYQDALQVSEHNSRGAHCRDQAFRPLFRRVYLCRKHLAAWRPRRAAAEHHQVARTHLYRHKDLRRAGRM